MLKKDSDLIMDLRETFDNLRYHCMKLNPKKCIFGVKEGKLLGYMVNERGIEANPDKVKAILNLSHPKTIKDIRRLMRG